MVWNVSIPSTAQPSPNIISPWHNVSISSSPAAPTATASAKANPSLAVSNFPPSTSKSSRKPASSAPPNPCLWPIPSSIMGLLQKFKEGLLKTHSKLAHEIKRIVTASPKLTADGVDQLEAALIAADLGTATAGQIVASVRRAYETQGRAGLDVFAIARAEVEQALASSSANLNKQPSGLTVVSIIGVNGTGKTTTAAKLAYLVQQNGHSALLAACDTFRAAAVEQLKLWGERLQVPVIAGAHGADPAAVAHDSIVVALARNADYLFIDTRSEERRVGKE